VSKTPIPAALREQVAADARHRCGYCLCQTSIVGMTLEVEHLKPEGSGGRTVRGNLWLACPTCNKHKGVRVRVPVPGTKRTVRLFNPRRDRWADHFRWIDGGERVEGITDVGRATVAALKLNLGVRVIARRRWISAGWHPPPD
jgi:HNH endonuclease